MAAMMSEHSRELLDAAGTKVELRRGGKGTPLLIIHGEFGVPGWLDTYRNLSEAFDVIVPSLPGFGHSVRPDWIMSVRDLAGWVAWFLRDMGIQTPINVVGFSLGGWVAAEMATFAPQLFRKLVLVSPMGLKPETGEIFDYFLDSGGTGLRRSFHAPEVSAEFGKYYGRELAVEELEAVEQHREMVCRVAWKPYMHSLTLAGLLPGVDTPTLIVWGGQDRITPLNSGELYRRAIKGSDLVIVDDCGHMPEMEKPDQFSSVVQNFLIE